MDSFWVWISPRFAGCAFMQDLKEICNLRSQNISCQFALKNSYTCSQTSFIFLDSTKFNDSMTRTAIHPDWHAPAARECLRARGAQWCLPRRPPVGVSSGCSNAVGRSSNELQCFWLILTVWRGRTRLWRGPRSELGRYDFLPSNSDGSHPSWVGGSFFRGLIGEVDLVCHPEITREACICIYIYICSGPPPTTPRRQRWSFYFKSCPLDL